MNLGIRRPLVYDFRFPQTAILDDFNRANAGPPPSANWTSGILLAQGLSVVSNQVKDAGAGPGDGYWSAANFGPDCEVYATIVTLGGNFRLFARGKQPGGSTFDGYGCQAATIGTNTARIDRWDNGVATQLGATIVTADNWVVGDAMGLEIVGSTITFYKRHNGIWTAHSPRSDATYAAAGFIGILLGSLQIADDFGGGTI